MQISSHRAQAAVLALVVAFFSLASVAAGQNVNGTQAVFEIPSGVTFVASPDGSATQVGSEIVVTIGRLEAGGSAVVHIQTQVNAEAGSALTGSIELSFLKCP